MKKQCHVAFVSHQEYTVHALKLTVLRHTFASAQNPSKASVSVDMGLLRKYEETKRKSKRKKEPSFFLVPQIRQRDMCHCNSARHRRESGQFTTTESKHVEIEGVDDNLINLIFKLR